MLIFCRFTEELSPDLELLSTAQSVLASSLASYITAFCSLWTRSVCTWPCGLIIFNVVWHLQQGHSQEEQRSTSAGHWYFQLAQVSAEAQLWLTAWRKYLLLKCIRNHQVLNNLKDLDKYFRISNMRHTSTWVVAHPLQTM